MSDARMVYMTCGSQEEAFSIARTLLEEHWIACANVFPAMTSLYRWAGVIEESKEVAVFLKTSISDAKLSLLMARIMELHSYECPAILVLPVTEGHGPFLKWLETSVNIA